MTLTMLAFWGLVAWVVVTLVRRPGDPARDQPERRGDPGRALRPRRDRRGGIHETSRPAPVAPVTGAVTVRADRPGGGAAAQAYDRWFDEPWGRYAFAVEARAIRRAAGVVHHTTVLDAGCGTGRFASILESEGGAVVAVDRDPGMLAVASSRLAGPCLLGDVACLPLRSRSVDVGVLRPETAPRPAPARPHARGPRPPGPELRRLPDPCHRTESTLT